MGLSRIFPYERRQKLIKHLAGQITSSIPELSRLLGVSEMTVRRDLVMLEKTGLVQRTRGGAVYSPGQSDETAFESKQDVRAEQKERIAGHAARTFLRDEAVVFLEGGTTVSKITHHLAGFKRLTLVTNGLNTAAALRPLSREHTVLCCGGLMRDLSMTLVGPQAEAYFAQVHAHVAFLSAQGFTLKQGFTDPNVLESQVKRAMKAAAQKTVMLIDASKWGRCSTLTTFPPTAVDAVVTDAEAPAEMREALVQAGVEVHVV